MLNEKNIKSYVNILYRIIAIMYIMLFLNGERKKRLLIN